MIVGCNKSEGVYDKLDQAEKDYLANRKMNDCLSGSKSHFESFKETSNELFYGAKAYANGKTFNHSFKDGSKDEYTHKVTIWKSTETDVYFLIAIDATTDVYKFLKIPKVTNEAMITNLQERLCAIPVDKTLKITTTNKTYVKEIVTAAKEYIHTQTYSFKLPAYFSVYKGTLKEQSLDDKGNYTGTAKTYTGTLGDPVDEDKIPAYTTYSEYASRLPTELCVVNYSTIPYSLTCDASGETTFLSSEL